MDDIRSARKNGETNYRRELDRPDSFHKAYYGALGGAFLCMEPEIIQMAAEWKERKLYARFADEPSVTSHIVDQVMEDIFQSHIAMIRNGTFQPDVWGKGGRGLSGERSCPQACAVYLLNLLILRVLFQGQCRIKTEDWSFISQFVRLNAPPPKKKDAARGGPVLQENLLPSEEIILRFMALFQLRRKDNAVLIEKREQAKEVEQQSLLDARINIFDFAQDATACAICKLHDASVPIAEKRTYQEELCRQGFHDFKFEEYIAQLQEALLTLSYEPSEILKSIQDGSTYLLRREIDPSLVLEWLLCVRQLFRIIGPSLLLAVYREYRLHNLAELYYGQFSSTLSFWKDLRDAVFIRYMDYVVIIQTFLALIKEIRCSAILLEDQDFIQGILPELVRHPEQFSIFFMAIADAIPVCHSVQSNRSILIIIDKLVLDSPLWNFISTKGATALLKVYSMTFQPSKRTDMSGMSDDILHPR